MAAVPGLLQDLPIPKLRQLGGKFGDELMASLNIKTVGEVFCEATVWQVLAWSTTYACAWQLELCCHRALSLYDTCQCLCYYKDLTTRVRISKVGSDAYSLSRSAYARVILAALLLPVCTTSYGQPCQYWCCDNPCCCYGLPHTTIQLQQTTVWSQS